MSKSGMAALVGRHALLGLALVVAAARDAGADERFFTYSYEPKTLPAESIEFESWITWRTGKDEGNFNRFDLREEFEYGLTDDLTSSLYLNFRSIEIDLDGEDQDESDFDFEGVSSEWKFQMTDPNTDLVGTLAYGEVTFAGDELELEARGVVGKNVGDFVTAANVLLEHEWEFEEEGTEREWKLEATGGVAYLLGNRVSVGVEGRNARVFDQDFDQFASAWFVGPALSYRTDRWWATLTVMPQLHGTPDTEDGKELDEFERLEARLIFGISF